APHPVAHRFYVSAGKHALDFPGHFLCHSVQVLLRHRQSHHVEGPWFQLRMERNTHPGDDVGRIAGPRIEKLQNQIIVKVLGFILQTEFRQIFRDKIILAMMFAMPNIQLIILPLAANFEVKNINVAYVDHDHSSYSRQLINKITSSGYFIHVGSPGSYKEGLVLIEEGKADLVLEIPPGFERNLVREGHQQVNLSVDAINGTKSALGGAYLVSVIADFNSRLDVNIKAPNG